MEQVEYPYRANPWIGAFGTVFFGAATWIIARDALTLDGPVTQGRVRLSAEWANEGLTVLAIASAALTLAALSMLLFRGRGAGRVVLDARGISAPKTLLSRRLTDIPYDTITSTRAYTIRSNRLYEITHSGGKLTLAASAMRRAAFEALIGELEARLEQQEPGQGAEHGPD